MDYKNNIPFLVFILGIWQIFSPFSFPFENSWLLGSDIALGLLLLPCALYRSEKGISLLGFLISATPLLFSAKSGICYVNNSLVGALLLFIGLVVPTCCKAEKNGEIPPGWSYNPSGWPQRYVIASIAFLCWMISRLLASFQLGCIDAIFDPLFHPGTVAVLTSDISKAFPVSDAGLGALAYTLEFLFTLRGGSDRWKSHPWTVLLFGILVIPVGIVSTILIILQPLAVHAWCFLCLITALLMALSIPLAIAEVKAALQFLLHKKGRSESTGKGASWRQGISLPLPLIASALFGIALMATPSLFSVTGMMKTVDEIAGPLIALFSLILLADEIRKRRFVLSLFALIAALLLANLFAA